MEKVVFELPALSISLPREVNREPEVRNVEEESAICGQNCNPELLAIGKNNSMS
jgi:hypothetical protein